MEDIYESNRKAIREIMEILEKKNVGEICSIIASVFYVLKTHCETEEKLPENFWIDTLDQIKILLLKEEQEEQE